VSLQLASARTERDKTFYGSKCATLDLQIEKLVYELYDARRDGDRRRRDKMKLVYTEHALLRIAKRQLETEWVERTIANPKLIEPDENDATLEH
jgi:hypothetical protein